MQSCIFLILCRVSLRSPVFNMSENIRRVGKRNRDTSSEKPGKLQRREVSSSVFWKTGLSRAINDRDLIVDDSSNDIVIIKDKYPKAKYHYLIIPKKSDVNAPRDLTIKHLDLVKILRDKALQLIENSHPQVDFKIGFHANPSMDLLHLHVISKDFVSPCLKTKKHWNSFNTEHFLNLSDIVGNLEKFEEVKNYPSDHEIEEYLKMPLKCNQCSFEARSMPNLKEHLLKHLQS